MVECRLCNTNNPAGMLHCSTCDGDLPLTNPLPMDNKPKMVIVHVEDALLDESAGERVAKRKGLSGKRFEREVALNLENSKAAPGTQPFLSGLASDNFTVAYLTNKDEEFRYRLQGHIRSLGFPMMADSDGVLVLPGSARDNIRSLSGRYEILYYFGSNAASTAKMMHIPGVYATIGDYAGQPENPYIAPETTPGAYTLSGLRPEPTPGAYTLTNPSDMGFRFVCRVCGKNPPMEECAQDARGVLVHMVDGGELRLVNEGMAQKMQQGIPQGPLRNPVPKPRRQTSKKTGKKRRESAKNYFQRLMSNDMMNKDFPRNDQRSAVALSYVEKEYGQRGVASVTKSWSPMTNPTTEGLPIYSAEPTGAKNLGMVSAVVQVGRGVVKDIGEGLQDFYRALIGGRQSMTEKRMMLAVAEMHLDLTNAVEQKGGNAIGNVRLDYEHPTQGGDITLIATADALKIPKKNAPFDFGERLKESADSWKGRLEEWADKYLDDALEEKMMGKGQVELRSLEGEDYFVYEVGFSDYYVAVEAVQEFYGILELVENYVSGQLDHNMWNYATQRRGPARRTKALQEIEFHLAKLYPPCKYANIFYVDEDNKATDFLPIHLPRQPHLRFEFWYLKDDIQAEYAKNPPGRPTRESLKKRLKDLVKDYETVILSSVGGELPLGGWEDVEDAVFYDLHEMFGWGAELVPPTPFSRKNPPSTKKMDKAKKAYKDFNGKDPKEVRTEKVDFGGMLVYLGDCWSIGYRNGKEGFGDDQKYIHEFGVDEETGRTFEEPKLYMTVPDQGKPMLVIKDGAWKIKTDKNGVSWIYY
jgi:uncharacterized protein YbjQ (UPF0145 family)